MIFNSISNVTEKEHCNKNNIFFNKILLNIKKSECSI